MALSPPPAAPRRPARLVLRAAARLLAALVLLGFALPARTLLAAEAQAILRVEPEIDCPGCEERLKQIMETTKGVRRVQVDVMESRLVVRFDPAQCTVGRLLGRLAAIGFQARQVK